MSYILISVIVGFLILIHELGHFLAARWVGIPVARFSVGFGPRLWGFRRGRTEYRLSWFFLGGYVAPDVEDEEDFCRYGIGRRVAFALGGPLANVVLAAVLFAVQNAWTNGVSLYGLTIQPLAQTGAFFWNMLTAFAALFSQPSEVSGIVGIVTQGGHYVGTDLLRAVRFAILLSLNLAVLNLLPIPALDGGRMALYALEALHPAVRRWHAPLTAVGWLLILGLMLYATALDVGRALRGGFGGVS